MTGHGPLLGRDLGMQRVSGLGFEGFGVWGLGFRVGWMCSKSIVRRVGMKIW